MIELKEKICKEGRVIGSDILKVDSFVNHQIDVLLMDKIAEFFKPEFNDINKIVTIEASGIAVATSVSRVYNYAPVVFAKKTKSVLNINDVYTTKIFSFTKKTTFDCIIDKKFLKPTDKVLIVDDFLAEGNAAMGLVDLCKQAGAEVRGVAVVIEKGFQNGRKRLEAEGIKVVSAAIIKEFKNGHVILK
ncbi:MAG: xanthine phosphoribosyltransferase [Bacilli bacterium]